MFPPAHDPILPAPVLVDVHWPDGDGRKRIVQLRADDPGVGILVVSAWRSAEASERENEILWLTADGLHNRESAEQLFLSRYTMESHVKCVYRKLAVSSRTRAVREARARGGLG